MIGQTVSHYRVLEKLGEGGMGVVYKGEDTKLGRQVALKFLPETLSQDRQAIERFQREARAASALNHPHICTIYDIDEHDGRQFIVMELLEGETLKHHIAGQPLPTKQVVELGLQIADALEAAHGKGLVHRDIKPGNIIVSQRGEAKLLDFGLVRLLPAANQATATEALTETRAVIGTLPYMAPEQVRGEKVDSRADTYALGAVLYEMATGQRPFREELATRLTDDILHKPPAAPCLLNPELPAELERIILKCLEKDPENRYQSGRDLIVDLRRLSAPAVLPAQRGKARTRPRGAAAKRIKALAVLPLENLSRDPEQDYFADGMTEALITALAKIARLRVISRTSAMRYKGTSKSLPEIAEELNVDAILEGSVLRVGEDVRITAQLIHAASDEHLWAESYERHLRDVLALQSEIARAIAQEIKAKLTPQEKARLARARPVNPKTYELYLKGTQFARQHFATKNPEDYRQAVELFQRALEQDANFELPRAALARSYFEYYRDYGQGKDLAEAEFLSRTLLAQDPQSASGHGTLASVCLWSGHKDIAAKEARIALKLNPSEPAGHEALGLVYEMSGLLDKAAQQFNEWLKFDPAAPAPYRRLVDCPIWSGDYDSARALMEKALTLYPQSPVFLRHLARVYYQGNQLPKAKELLEESIRLEPYRGFEARCLLALVLVRLGDSTAGEALLTPEVLNYARIDFVECTVYPAQFYSLAGNIPLAIQWFERAVIMGNENYPWLAMNPDLDPLRQEDRFQQLLSRAERRYREERARYGK